MTKITPMTHRARMEKCLSGEKTDRTPVALWRHFPVADQDPVQFARSTLEFQESFNFDFVKITPASSYCLVDWGVQTEWRGNPEGTRDFTRRVVRTPEDWTKLQLLDPLRGNLASTLDAIRLIRKNLPADTPIIQTIFNPLSQAKNLAGQDVMLDHLRNYPEYLKIGLQTILQSTLDFIESLKEVGMDGIFYAVQHAQPRFLSREEFDSFSRLDDLQLLKACDFGWLNVIHLHGDSVFFDAVCDYPAQILNWHDRETGVSIADGMKSFPGLVCGGLSRDSAMLLGTPDYVHEQAKDAIEQSGGTRFILGTGCVLMTTTPNVNIHTAVESAKKG